MGFKEVQSLDADIIIALGGKDKRTGKTNPKTAEGYYLGARKVESRKAKAGYSYLHFLQTEAGNLGIWGKTDLDRKLTTVTPGAMVRITQTSMQPTPNGDMYKFKVEVDLDNTIEVNISTELATSSETEDTEDQDSEADESANEGASLAAQQAAERRAKVQALLNKNK